MIAMEICVLRTHTLPLSYAHIHKNYSLKSNLYDILTLCKNINRIFLKCKMLSAQVETSLRLYLTLSLYKHTYIVKHRPHYLHFN